MCCRRGAATVSAIFGSITEKHNALLSIFIFLEFYIILTVDQTNAHILPFPFTRRQSTGAAAAVDPILNARCDAKCWYYPTDRKLDCLTNCLQEPWTKPGECPSSDQLSIGCLNLEEASSCIKSCKIDSECPGMSKCCADKCGVTCHNSLLQLDTVSGLPPIPQNIMVDVSTENQPQDGVVILVHWSMPNEETSTSSKILYLLEERHHVGKQFVFERLSDWTIRRRSSSTKHRISIKNLFRPGRWYLFRITAVNENGTRGPSNPSTPFFSTSITPKAPSMPKNLRVGATSWGNGKLHLQLTWKTPFTDLPIHRYRVTCSRLKNFTLMQHHHTLPPNMTYFWLKDLEPNTEYFLQVQAFSKFGKRRLAGDTASIVFNTPNHKHTAKSLPETPETKKFSRTNRVKYKRNLQNFRIEKIYWLRDQLLATVSWSPVKRPKIFYSVTWSHNGCHGNGKAWYIARTDMARFEVYDLLPGCEYVISVKTTWHQTLFANKLIFSTDSCIRQNVTLMDEILIDCPLPVTPAS